MPSKFIQFFKREFGPYFRDFSEYDFRFFRTFRDVFLRPTKVIEANDGTYTGELKFVFNVFTLLFIGYFVFSGSWINDLDAYMLWRYPFPHQEYLRLSQAIEEDYYGYIQAVAFIPIYFVLLKLLFYRKKPWGFFLSGAFYLSTVIFVLLIGFTVIFDLLSIDSELITVPIIAAIAIYPVVALRLQHWFWSAIKGLIATALPLILTSLFLESILFNLILNLSTSEKVLPLKASNHKLISATELPIENEPIYQVFIENENEFTLLGAYSLRWFSKGAISKEIYFPEYSRRKISKLSDGKILLFSLKEKQLELTLFSPTGDSLVSDRFEVKNQERQASIRERDVSNFDLFTAGLHIVFTRKEKWSMMQGNETLAPEILATFTPLPGNGHLEERIEKPGNHIKNQSIRFVDTLNVPVWEQVLYDKSDAFDPLDPLGTHMDQQLPVVYTHYTLANDSNYHSFIQAFDLGTGKSLWKNNFYVPVHVSEYQGMASDEKYLYLFGEGHKFYAEWFWQPTYHVGMIVKINKQTGEYLNHIFIGPDDSWGAHSRIHDLVADNGKLYFLSHDQYSEEEMPWDKESHTYLKVLSRDF